MCTVWVSTMLHFLTMKKLAAIHSFSGVIPLARALGITRSAVYQWPDVVPEPRASHIREVARARGITIRSPRVPAKT